MKRFTGALFGLLLGLGVAATPAHAGLFFYDGQLNQILFNNYENLFSGGGHVLDLGGVPAGTVLPASTSPEIGDHLAGIFQVNRINNLTGPGTNIPTVTEFTGVFAQRIIGISPIGDGFHLILDNPTIFSFTDGLGDSFTFTDLLATGHMFAVYADSSPVGGDFTFQGTMASNVADATDGSLRLTAFIDLPNDGDNGAIGDVHLFTTPINGVSTANLSIGVNNTGLLFAQITPLTFTALTPGATGQLPLASRFTFNFDTFSKWRFSSFDPAEVRPNVIPEPGSMLLLGTGLMALGFTRRRKLSA